MAPHNFLSCLSTRLAPSGIRKLEQLAKVTPGLISLGPGQPDDTLFPSYEISSGLRRTFDDPTASARCLQYGPSQGDPQLVALLVKQLQNHGVTCDETNILVTAGAQQGLDLITQLLVDPGDCVLVQRNTYPGALQVFRARGAITSSLSDQKPSIDDLGAKFIYAMADFQNPTGEVLSLEERSKLLAIARQRDVFLVEDTPYREINFSGNELPPTLLEMDCDKRSIDAGRTLLVGSFSKVIAPGLRVGWVVGPAYLISLLTLLRQGGDLQPGTLSQAIVVNLLKRGLDEHIVRVRRRYEERRDAMLDALQAHLAPYATWNVPKGGFFVWVQLTVDIDSDEMLNQAIRNGVTYVPGSEFHHNACVSSNLRLSFSSVDPALINEAIRRLSLTIALVLKNRKIRML